jgi:hypothetical protein
MSDITKDLSIKVTINKKKRTFDLANELKITYDSSAALTEEMSQQPAKYAWMGVLFSLAQDHYERLKRGQKTLYATLSKKHRKRRENTNLKATDKIVDADVEADKEYIDYGDTLQDAKLSRDILSAAVGAFEQRKDMMQSIGGQLKREQDGTLRTLQDKVKEKTRKRKDRS